MTDDDLMSRLHDLNPVHDDPTVPAASEMRRRVSETPTRRSGRPRALPTLLAGVLTAGAVAGISMATNDGSTEKPATAPRQVVGGHDVISQLASSPPVSVAATHLPSSVIEMLATGGYGVNVSRAWELVVPGDQRPAWLFAGDRRLALVVPRALRGPDGERMSGAASVFGETITEVRKSGLVGTQSGGGQASRVIVLLPSGAPTPSIVQAGTSDTVRPLEHSGQLFVGEPKAGEQVYVPSQPDGRQRFGGAN